MCACACFSCYCARPANLPYFRENTRRHAQRVCKCAPKQPSPRSGNVCLPFPHPAPHQSNAPPRPQVGSKLRVCGAELASERPCDPLDGLTSGALLRLHYNGVCPAAWDARLGAQASPAPMALRPLWEVRRGGEGRLGGIRWGGGGGEGQW